MHLARRLLCVSGLLAVAAALFACAARSVAPTPASGAPSRTVPQVIQTGHQPAQWVDFDVTGTYPQGIVAHDADVWFAANHDDAIGHIDMTTGATAYHHLPSGFRGNPLNLAYGRDRDIWLCMDDYEIGKMTPSGAFTLYGLGQYNECQYLVPGPDGRIWFLDWPYAVVKAITASGKISTYNGIDGFPDGIAVGPDGNLWITQGTRFNKSQNVVRMTPAGVATLYPTGQTDSWGIVTGSDGNLWFAEHTDDAIARLTTNGVVTAYPIDKIHPHVLAATPDGLIWFSHSGGIATFDVRTHQVRGLGYSPAHGGWNDIQQMTPAADGNIWFVDSTYRPDTVTVYVRRILTVTPASLTLDTGGQGRLTAIERPTEPELFATSSDPSIASVTDSGSPFTVTAEAAGKCTIRVHDSRHNVFDVAVTVVGSR